MSLLGELIQYSSDVTAGNIIACEKHKWACQRFLNDIDKQGTEEFPFVFLEEKAERFLNWIRLFKHRKGVLKGQYIEPHIIQKFVFGNIYGWINKDTEYRRFNKAYWQVGRKNAKSQSLSCVASYELMALGEGTTEVYCTATKRKQARIVWEETEAMLNTTPELKGKYKIAYAQIKYLKTGSIMEALSKQDGKKGDGYNPQCGIIDEYHAHETSEMYDIIDSGMVARPQPLLMIITTAGFDLSNPCYSVEYKLVSHILDPNNPYENDNYFVMINELDKDDDIKDEKNWEKANPIVCSYPEGIDSIRKRLQLALEAPEKMMDFLTKTLNVWIQRRENGFMDLSKWAKCSEDFDLHMFKDREGIAGVDLSATLDLTSVDFEFKISGSLLVVLLYRVINPLNYSENIFLLQFGLLQKNLLELSIIFVDLSSIGKSINLLLYLLWILSDFSSQHGHFDSLFVGFNVIKTLSSSNSKFSIKKSLKKASFIIWVITPKLNYLMKIILDFLEIIKFDEEPNSLDNLQR